MKSPLDRLVILETYPAGEFPYDGLTGVFDAVKEVGVIASDTSGMENVKVLVCGIATLYEGKISPLNQNIVFTTFESDQLPTNWVQAINAYHCCIVPHQAVKNVFQSSGVRIPIFIVHNGYQRLQRERTRSRRGEEFNVGFLGIPVSRKNLLKLYAACKSLQHTTIPGIRLHIHASCFYDWLDQAPFEEVKNDPMVVWTSGKYTLGQVAEWYHRLSCYIFPSSGEGWSFTPRESMYLGVPTILSDIPVHRELADSGFCKVIPPSGQEPAYFNDVAYGSWARIETEVIRAAISDVYGRYDHFTRLAEDGARWIEGKWLNGEICGGLLEVIGQL